MTRVRSPTSDIHVLIEQRLRGLHAPHQIIYYVNYWSSPCLQDAMVAQQEQEMMTVYHAAPTRSSRVVWLLEELGVPYKPVSVDFPKELFTPEFLKINPMGS